MIAARDVAAIALAIAGSTLLAAAFVDWVGYSWFVLQWAIR